MPSPFPGMNPYLEQKDVWTDFHDRLIPAIADELAAQVDPNYIVKIDEQLYVHEVPSEQRRLIGKADVSLAPMQGASSSEAATAVLEPPSEIELVELDVERIPFVEIRDRQGRELITAIELLSPANKYAGSDRELYLKKRHGVLHSPVHFVEIDLLRGGPRMPSRGLSPCDYCVVVSRAEQRPKAGCWALRLHDPLPVIPVPLRAPDADARLDVQQLLHRVYDAARYRTYIYDGTPEPALSPEDAAWAQQFIPQKS